MAFRLALVGPLVVGLAVQSFAQQPGPGAVPPAGGGASPVTAAEQASLSAIELDALLAPIALYPDALLAQLLMASTYPLEVVQADRWVAANKKLKGDQLKAAAEKQPWDASVKSLVATPSVLEMMSRNLDWTQKLGDALLAQQPDVMDGIQRMRARAYDARKLVSGTQQKVTVQQEAAKRTILIEPASPDTIYLPYYDPAVVYGAWPDPTYPPYYFPAPAVIATGVLATGIAFGAGYALGRWTTSGYWGGSVNWVGGAINIDRNRVTHWQHNPQHRHGVRYRSDAVGQRFSNNAIRSGSADRMNFRGRDDGQGLRPGGERGGAGIAARPDQRPADRPRAEARPERPGGGRIETGNRPGSDRVRPGGGRLGAGHDRGSAPPRAAAQPRHPGSGTGLGRPGRDSAFGNMQPGRAANLHSQRGHASMARAPAGGGRGMHGGGAGRRSDIQLKNHVVLLGHLANGLGFYSFAYNGSPTAYVGVIAQEVQDHAPWTVHRASDGYLRVDYRQLGIPFQTLKQWKASGSQIPVGKNQN
ncbi:MAG TPA: DUF3300 domain-containing protein [Bosea sp. (in: a-proteobacteria)]|jgi:hypothetical protein|nr:DUF3300 domain-containing protein [Bosea sp. (in: a-proteobacteria)]